MNSEPTTPTTKAFEGIEVRNAREHNLKNVSVKIPRNALTVVTGLSGSGKSSLAFDTIYAEGQRRYMEGLSVYSRQFLEPMKKPEVESIQGLSPAVAIDQKTLSSHPRSTVGTVTEIYDYVRLLFARLGVAECPEHRVPVQGLEPEQILQEVFRWPPKTKFYLLAPVARSKKGEFLAEFQKWEKKGFVKARVNGEWIELAQAKKLKKTKAHDIDLVVDQLIIDAKHEKRLRESLHLALSLANGRVSFETIEGEQKNFSIHSSCPVCDFSFPELEPRLFSFNNPRGACPDCKGLGVVGLSEYELDGYESAEDESDESAEIVAIEPCEACQGTRLRPEALSVKINSENIAHWSARSIEQLKALVLGLEWSKRDQELALPMVKEIVRRLDYLLDVGCGYLSLGRASNTLSGGEAQRIRLASQVGSGLTGVLYVMDEPSIGLHPRDHHRLLKILDNIKEQGNTVLVVEHDEDTMLAADHLIDLGPRAGRLGGELIAEGTPQQVMKQSGSLTGRYLAKSVGVKVPKRRRAGNGLFLNLKGATGHNLKNVNLELPLGCLIGVSGVSGSGKSTLIIDTLFRILSKHFFGSLAEPEAFDTVEGLEHLDKVIQISQKPIGRTPRSTPATYVGLFPLIRDLFAQLPEAKMRGYRPGHFSFNVKGGRCEACQGNGMQKIEMHFLSDVYVPCESCQGRRYSREVLNIRFKQKNIAEVLQMSVEEATPFFENQPQIHRKLKTLLKVGLDYMTLGQSSTTLSGGEAQRVKLSKELSKRGTGKTLYILDEPTTGLHFEDVKKLVQLLHELVDQGNTVLVIEHHLDVLKNCDHVIDLGPEGGDGGGRIVAAGTPEKVSLSKTSVTAPYLKKTLEFSF